MLRAMSRRLLAVAALSLLAWLPSASAGADVLLPRLVSDGMVLQARAPIRVWGWASEGEQVEVTLNGRHATATARDGRWSAALPPLEPGGPFEMTITGRNALVVHDVLVGEVWLCSGQSNMEFELSRAADSQAAIDAPADPLLRMFTVSQQLAATPAADVGGQWESATPQTRGHFSAVGYYFGRALRAARGVPVGLLHASWGGTPAEAWTSREALRRWGLPSAAFDALAPPSAAAQKAYERQLAAWRAAGSPQGEYDDGGVADVARGWAAPELDTKRWRSMTLPLAWEKRGPELEVDGAIWFRKEVSVPPDWAGRDLVLQLGAIDDLDTTYFNGVAVGSVAREVPTHWQVRRRYRVPASAVRAGRNVIAVRVWDRGGEGGFMGPAAEMSLGPDGAEKPLPLASDWRFEAERTRPSRPQPPGLHQNLPSVLYNGMIAPLEPYAIAGATWYQGESNTARASQYRALLGSMIEDWRGRFGVGTFPFLLVQLAPYMAIDPEPRESDWALLREAQARVAREVPRAGLVVITDVGDEKDIHPTRKQPVGERLALAARQIAYGEKIVASGPTLRSAVVEGDQVVVSFDNVGKGLVVRGPKLTGFAIAGRDEKFVDADAVVRGDRVVVKSPRVATPAYVRFGWANYPVVNLWNADGLPATPFRTDPP
jgi:sialate O-acetylesterase